MKLSGTECDLHAVRWTDDLTESVDVIHGRQVLPVRTLEAQFALLFFQPAVWKASQHPLLIQRPGGILTQVQVAFALVAFLAYFAAPRHERLHASGLRVPDRVVLLTAVAAKLQRVEALLTLGVRIHLPA